MRICVLHSNANSYSAQRFIKEGEGLGIEIFISPWEDIVFDHQKKVLMVRRIPLETFDAILPRGSSRPTTPLSLILEYCKEKRVPLLNEAFYSTIRHTDKLRQQLFFCQSDIPALDTLFGENLPFQEIKKKFGLPFVAKLTQGSLGRQVWKIKSEKEFLNFLKKRVSDKKSFLFQKFYAIQGDYRVLCIGNKIFGPVFRKAKKNEWRTNIKGATHERALMTSAIKNTVKRVIRKSGLEYCGLDILIDENGKARVIELNTMAQFRVFEKVFPEINVARLLLELLGKKVKK